MNSTILEHFQTVDVVLASVIPNIWSFTLEKSENPFFSLIESIISQQLSVKAGDTIVNRFLKLFPDGKVTPETVLAISREKLRGVGMSWSKAEYIHNIAQSVANGELDFVQVDKLTDEKLIVQLTAIKGIGQWTAEMFLMFALGRPDVFSAGDVGLQRAIQKLYNLKRKPTKKQLLRISNKWKPYRTYACRILWRSLEEK